MKKCLSIEDFFLNVQLGYLNVFHVVCLGFSIDNTCALTLVISVKLSLRESAQERESSEN